MKIKYFGTAYEKGLTLTLSIFDKEGLPVIENVTMTETGVNSAIYKTGDILSLVSLSAGIYTSRVEDSDGNFLGYGDIIFNGTREVTLLEIKFMTEVELMQLRDALGIDGDKMVAREGQLQKKSESPYNTIVDTRKIGV